MNTASTLLIAAAAMLSSTAASATDATERSERKSLSLLAISENAASATEATDERSVWSPTTVGLHIGSHHVDEAPADREPWNNSNPGVYASWSNGLVLGTLHNSERRQSVYAAWMAETPRWHGLSAAAMAGVITGYAKPLKVLASVSAAMDVTDHATVRLSYMPKTHPKKSAVVHLSSEWRF